MTNTEGVIEVHKILLPIDTKSLYYNVLNDNTKGHTCTVATPIKQGKSINQLLQEVYKIPEQVDFEKHEILIKELTKNSKSVVKINNVFVFEKLKVNGKELMVDANYCIYTKEEIDKSRAQFGRVKLHYPLSIRYEELNIDNRKVINAISDFLHGYAFIVESFEYDLDDRSLNFNVLLAGYSNIPYSKIFINNKGVGSKYNKSIKNHFDMYDSEIIALRKKYSDQVSTENFVEYIEAGFAISKQKTKEYLEHLGATKIRDVSDEYPYSLFDLQFYIDDAINYAIVLSTYTKSLYFNLSCWQNQFINTFDNVLIFLVTDIGDTNNVVKITKEDLMNYSVMMNSVRFVK